MKPGTANIVSPLTLVVVFSLVAAAFSIVGVAVASYDRPVPWTALLAGVVVACTGFQIANARRIFALNAPTAIRGWMTPTSRACYLTGAILLLLGVRALLHRALVI